MFCRIIWIGVLFPLAPLVQGSDRPRPKPLTPQHVRGLSIALDDPVVRLDAFAWCKEMQPGHTELFQPIRGLCTHDDPRVRSAAASALAGFGDDAVALLIELMGQDATRLSAITALGWMGGKAGPAVAQLARLLNDSKVDLDTRRAAAEALGGIGETFTTRA